MTNPDAPLVHRHDDDRGVCTLTLNRPAAFNALTEEMLTALQSELDNLSKSQKLRVLVIAAEGKAFCAGHDLRQMRAEPSMDYYQKLFSQCGQMMMSIQKLQVPVIAKVQGIAGNALHLGNDGHLQFLNAHHHLTALRKELLVVIHRGLSAHLSKVMPCTKSFAFRCNDENAKLLAFGQIVEFALQGGQHLFG